MAVIDPTRDIGNTTLHKLASWHPLPDYVRRADAETTLRPRDMAANVYADPHGRRFPCHTKAATLLSWLYFMDGRAGLGSKTAAALAARIRRFGDAHGIGADLRAAEERRNEIEKVAEHELPDQDFALVRLDDDGLKERRYPLRNRAEVKAAAEWLVRHRDDLAYRDRQMIAARVLDKAAATGAAIDEEIDQTLQRTAGRGLYNPERAANMLLDRSRLSKDAGIRARLVKLAGDVRANPLLTTDPRTARELANTVDQVDRTLGIVGRYSEAVPRPEDVLFEVPIKLAEDISANSCALANGRVYDQRQFERLSPAFVRQALGDRIADETMSGLLIDGVKFATIAVTLPLPDAHVLCRLMDSIGEEPLHTKRASIGPTAEEREELARQYAWASRLPEVAAGAPPSGIAGSRVIG